MTNKELQDWLDKFPPETEVMLHLREGDLKAFEYENICIHRTDNKISEKTGGIIWGIEPKVIVINPPIL